VVQPAVIFDNVSKKFSRGERFSSLRDLVPAMTSALLRRKRSEELESKEFWALRDVSFEVRPGEALGIIGPNGAGKSTALKVLTRILRPDRGRSIVRGRVGALVEIAAGFHQDLTGRENVYMQGAIMGMKRAEITKKFDEIVDFAGIAEFIDTPVKRYSSGMNARLGFAVAAHLDPEVLLIDEVLSVGDLSFQEKCYERMQTFARSGIAIVFVSHNLSAISTLCSRVLVLRHGGVEALAPTHEALTAYATLVQEARAASSGRRELVLQVSDVEHRPVNSVQAGDLVRVRCTGYPSAGGGRFHTELQVRHLETGTVVYRCQSPNVGAPPVRVGEGEMLESQWVLSANLGRGHYALTCALVDEGHRWVAVSNPGLLTINERDSEQAVVHLAATCSARAVVPTVTEAPEVQSIVEG
jgi:lipopolysaccharide transport system ATP-binding protein